jgi:hypothetical protein
MLKKLSIILSFAAALGLGLALAAPEPAFAKPPKKKVVVVKKNVHKNVYVVGKSYNGHVYYGRSRHRWHGRWYAYGVGPCWIKVGGLWFWNVAACP